MDARKPKRAWQRVRDGVLGAPGLGVLVRATHNYVMHQCAIHAGSVAFSWVLSLFPLLILLSAMASYFGQPGDAAALIMRVTGYAPQLVQDALEPVIRQ